VFAGGDPPRPPELHDVASARLVVAADSGVAAALAAGCRVDVVVGDLDSASPDTLRDAIDRGAEVERHPVAKNETDLELALGTARARGARDVLVLGAGGGRLDHLLANALLLAAPGLADLRVRARIGDAEVVVVRDVAVVAGRPGDLCTLLALGGPALGVTTEGLRYPLAGDTLYPGSTRGVSNELVAHHASVRLTGGVLVAVLPEARSSR
jgi:thiamine pyrophosphokinase